MIDETTTHIDSKVKDCDWPWHVRNYDASGLTKTAYCKQNHLSYHRFLYWHTKLSDGSSRGFSEVKVRPLPTLSSEVCCTLELTTGDRLLIQSEAALQVILQALGR